MCNSSAVISFEIRTCALPNLRHGDLLINEIRGHPNMYAIRSQNILIAVKPLTDEL